MSMGQQTKATSYWVYSSEGKMDPCVSAHADVCILSVLLGPELQRVYSAIRLVIVYEPELAQRSHLEDFFPIITRPSIDANKIRLDPNSSRRESKLLTLPAKGPANLSNLPCMIVLKMTEWSWRCQSLEILGGLTFGDSEGKSSQLEANPYRIALDHVFHTTTLLTVLESSFPFRIAQPPPYGDPIPYFQFHVHSPCPNDTRPSPVDRLPTAVILKIVRTAARMSLLASGRWSMVVFSCALVRKSWKFVIQVFFELMGSEDMKFEPQRLAHALIAQPHMGRFVQEFRGWARDYRGPRSLVAGPLSTRDCLSDLGTVLQLCPHINVIDTGPKTAQYLQQALSGLQEVQEFLIHPAFELEANLETKSLHSSFPTLYEIIKGWKQLRHLCYWHEDIPTGDLESIYSDEHSSSSDAHHCLEDMKDGPIFSLETLKLKNVMYAGHHILKLISSPVASLRNLRLHKNRFISNAILRSILSTCRNTLCDLYLYDSVSQPLTGEVFALDAELPNMRSLTTLSISPDLCTHNTIIRGPSNRHQQEYYHHYPCCVLNVLQPETNYVGIIDTDNDIFWRHEEVFSGLVLAQWHNIRIWTAGLKEFGVEASEKSRWQAAGQRKGIKVEIEPRFHSPYCI